MSEKSNTKIFSGIKSNKILQILIILIIVVIAAILLYNLFAGREKTVASASGDGSYASEMEASLEKTLSAIEGAGNVSVMITFSGEGEKVLAMETVIQPDGTKVTTPVLVDGEVVVLEEKSPEISGVLIVAEGADNISVRFNLLQATASVLNINQSLIKVYTKG